MFSTTLRIEEDLGHFLQEAAKRSALSVNAFLAELLRREREAAARKRLAKDWAAYAHDAEVQSVDYAFAAQAQVIAEPTPKASRAKAKPDPKPNTNLRPKSRAR